MSKDKLAWTAAPRPVPMTVTVGSFALLASAGLFLINGLPLLDTSQYPKLPGNAVAVFVVFFAIFALVMVLIPLLAAIFALRGSRWPAFLAGGFAILMIVGVIGVSAAMENCPQAATELPTDGQVNCPLVAMRSA